MAVAVANSLEHEANPRDLICDYLVQRVEHGAVKGRVDVVSALEDVRLEVPRQGKSYITARDPDSGKPWRLKGELYEQDFRPERLDLARPLDLTRQRGRDRDYGPAADGFRSRTRCTARGSVRTARRHAPGSPFGAPQLASKSSNCVMTTGPKGDRQSTIIGHWPVSRAVSLVDLLKRKDLILVRGALGSFPPGLSSSVHLAMLLTFVHQPSGKPSNIPGVEFRERESL